MKSIVKSNQRKEFRSLSFITLLILIWLLVMSSSCSDTCDVTHSYLSYQPIYTTTEELRASVSTLPAREINNPGRLYFKDGFMFINEAGVGFHVIDNSNPLQPQKISFINLPGNFDLAAKGDYLYADSYIDLVVFDISDPSNIREVNRLEAVFANYDAYIGTYNEERGIITDWEETLVEETFASECGFDGIAVNDALLFDESSSGVERLSTTGESTGVGGSLAKFTIYDDYLYTINSFEMRLFEIDQLDQPEVGNIIQLGWGIETIFPYGDKLFIGAQNGMHIYDNTTPESPEWLSTYSHVNSCDPVVVQDDYAYVTLRSGTECDGFTNQLDIVDISDLNNPRLFKTYEMLNPHGLGIDGSCLFITEGEFGLKFFNADDPNNLEQITHREGFHAIDVIPLNEVLMLIGNDGFHQYNYDCETGDLERLSTIQINPAL